MKKFVFLCVTLLVSQLAYADLAGCRVSGGGIDNNPNPENSSSGPLSIFAGQVGAPSALPPQPSGEIIIRSNGGIAGIFTFGGGTSSAPPGTEIDKVSCSSPGYCGYTRPAPAHTIDFEGIGTFQNIGNVSVQQNRGGSNTLASPTYHWFEVSIRDQGEPGVVPDDPDCSSAESSAELNCDCPDWYSIKIYDGVTNSIQPPAVIYEASGYIDGGDLQIHPLTGFDSNQP